MQTLARRWCGKNASPLNTFYLATTMNTGVSLFDTCSDLAVAIQLMLAGEWAWGITVLLIDYLPMWQVLLHATTSKSWKEMEDRREKWITCLILVFAPFAFPLLQLRWLLSVETANKATFNFRHQNSKVAELISGTLESPLQFALLIIMYSYQKLPLPWSEATVIRDTVGNELNLGGLPGMLSVIFSVLTIVKSCIDVAEAKTKKDAVEYAAFSLMTSIFRLSGYILCVITFREFSSIMFALIALVTLTVIVRFDKKMRRGFSKYTTLIVGLFIPSAVSMEPHKAQYKDSETTTTSEATKNRRKLTGTIAMWSIPIILFFNSILLLLLTSTEYKVSTDLLDENVSKIRIRDLILFLVLPTGVCSFIGAVCIRNEKHKTITTIVMVTMAILTIASASGSMTHVFSGKFHAYSCRGSVLCITELSDIFC